MTTSHPHAKSPESDHMTLLAALNLRDDGADELVYRFARAAARADDAGTLELLVRLAERLADDDEHAVRTGERQLDHAGLLILAARLPASSLESALAMAIEHDDAAAAELAG